MAQPVVLRCARASARDQRARVRRPVGSAHGYEQRRAVQLTSAVAGPLGAGQDPCLLGEDAWVAKIRASETSSRMSMSLGRRAARLGAVVALLASLAMALAYAGAAYWILSDLHVGHVVQDGIDTGDMLALPPLAMAMVSLVLATCCLHRVERLAPTRA